MSPASRSALRIALCLLVLYVVWGSTYLAQRVALAGFPPLRMAGLRIGIAGGLLYLVLRARGAAAPTPSAWRAAALSSFFFLVLGMGGSAVALQRVPSGVAALVFASMPLWAAFFDRLWGGRLARAELLGLLLGFAGVLLVALRGALRADPWMAALLLFAAASYAFGSVLTRRLPLAPGPIGTASQLVVAGALLSLLSAITGEPMRAPSSSSLLALGYLIVFGSMLAYSAFGYLLRHARPALATSYSYVNPIIALALGATLGGERVTPTDAMGLVVVLGAVALVGLGARRGEPRAGSNTGDDRRAAGVETLPAPVAWSLRARTAGPRNRSWRGSGDIRSSSGRACGA
ncbi:MAG: drug/metabolite exporter YedA [Byssovorax sp.]